MKVVIINRSDALGGAAIASSRLCHALQGAGTDARMLVMDRRTTESHVQAAGSLLGNRYRFMAERMGIFARNGLKRGTLFQIDTATHGIDLAQHPWVRETDVIVLNWINQAMLSLNGVKRLAALGKPVVWVMHDMWNCTGVCHHREDCVELYYQCESCPLLPRNSHLAQQTWQRKHDLYSSRRIHFVAVSKWLRDECLASSLMRDSDITVIPNACALPQCDAARLSDNPWGVEAGRLVIAMGAARLDDPVKGFDRLTAALQWLADNQPDAAARIHLVLYGALRDESLLHNLPVAYTHLGYISHPQEVFRRADIVISASTRESFGYTLAEGMACGCTAVTTGIGGQRDIVDHLHNGYVADSLEPQALAQGIVWALDNPQPREQQQDHIISRFAPSIVAQRHLDIYNRLLSKQ